MAHLILKVLYNKKEIRLKLHQTWKWGIRNETWGNISQTLQRVCISCCSRHSGNTAQDG